MVLSLLNLDLDCGVSLCFCLQKLHRAHVDEAEAFAEDCGSGGPSRARGSQDDDTRRSPGSVDPEAEINESSKVLDSLLEGVAGRVVVKDEMVEGVFDPVETQLVLCLDLVCVLIDLLTEDAGNHPLDVGVDAAATREVVGVHADDLVWDHAHLLQRQSLHLRSREAADHPALLDLLQIVNLFFDDFDDGLVVD